jgi:hypothetical protein
VHWKRRTDIKELTPLSLGVGSGWQRIISSQSGACCPGNSPARLCELAALVEVSQDLKGRQRLLF